MATLRETLQAQIDESKAEIDAIKATLQTASPALQQVLGMEYAQVVSLIALVKANFPEMLV